MRETADFLPLLVVDVLHDLETPALIVEMLNTRELGWRDEWGRDFSLSEVREALAAMLRDGWIEAYADDGDGFLVRVDEVIDLENTWFRRTEAGVDAWEAWDGALHP